MFNYIKILDAMIREIAAKMEERVDMMDTARADLDSQAENVEHVIYHNLIEFYIIFSIWRLFLFQWVLVVGLNYQVDTMILTQNEIEMVRKSMGMKKFVLLYRATRDGFTAKNFHDKVYARGNTITFIKTTDNYVFGGYTTAYWDTANVYRYDSSAFIFSLRRSGSSHLITFGIRSTSYYGNAIYGGASYGPTFGNGHDIYVRDRSNIYTGSYTNTGSTYYNPGSSYLAGNYNSWKTSEIEVFQLS
jgi:hypothetical protein